MPEKETDYLKINVLLHLLSIDWMVEKQRKMYCSPPPQPPLPNKQTKQKEQTNRQTRKKRYSQHENDQEHKLELFI